MKYEIQNIRFLILGVFLCLTGNSFAKNAWKVTATPLVDMDTTIAMRALILNESYSFNSGLSPSYNKTSEKKNAVTYVVAGAANKAFIHRIALIQFRSCSCLDMLPESMVVGGVHRDRKINFTSSTSNTADTKEFPAAGRSKRCIALMEFEAQEYAAGEGMEGSLIQRGATRVYHNLLKKQAETNTATFRVLERQKQGDVLPLVTSVGLGSFFTK